MGTINLQRVLLGGLLAGLVLNVLIAIVDPMLTGREFEAAMTALGKTLPQAGGIMAYHVALGFVLGIALVWLYALIRPRLGPGAKTAIIAGLVGWLFMGVFNALREGPLGLVPTRLHVLMNLAWLIEMPLATAAGAWLYREEGMGM